VGKKVEIIDELEKICEMFEKKYGKGGAFNPYKYYRGKQNSSEPVYFVGAPGLSTAISITILILCTAAFVSYPFPWWSWIVYLIICAMFVRFALKIDKAKQIRYMAFSLSRHAINNIRKANESEDESEALQLYEKAEEFLSKARSWIDEPSLERQFELVQNR